MEEQTIELKGGLALGQAAGDFLYLFNCPGPGLWAGRRGHFDCEAGLFPARVEDKSPAGLMLAVAGQAGPSGLSGRFKPGPRPSKLKLRPEPETSYPEGWETFLDPQEGWLMRLAEASAGQSPPLKAELWPRLDAEALGAELGSGICFIWRQKPSSGAPLAQVAEAMRKRGGRLLIAASTAEDLKPVASLQEALFCGPAPSSSPLFGPSLAHKILELEKIREAEEAELRDNLAQIQRRQAAVRAQQGSWEDLAQLESRFKEAEALAAELQSQRQSAESELETASRAWEKNASAVEAGGLMSWLRPAQRAQKAAQAAEAARVAVEEAENKVDQLRQRQQSLANEALNLSQRLSHSRQESETWPSPEELAERQQALKQQTELAAQALAAACARPKPQAEELLERAETVLALTADTEPGEKLAGSRFDHILLLISQPPDLDGRAQLASLALMASTSLTIASDFSLWPIWGGEPPYSEKEGRPLWRGFTVAEESDDLSLFLAQGGLFELHREFPAGTPALKQLELEPKKRPESLSFNYIVAPRTEEDESGCGGELRPQRPEPQGGLPLGLGLRAVGDLGPANPISALMIARAAANFARLRAQRPAVTVITASPAQARLIELMAEDLGLPAEALKAGLPEDFFGCPPVPLVILEPAFESPHLSHPWAWPSFGRQRLAQAWRLAEEEIWLAGRRLWLERLPEAAPLALLWKRAEEPAAEADFSDRRPSPPPFWEALDRAKEELWAIVPTLEPAWWRPLEEHFLAAAARRVRVHILIESPEPGQDRQYLASVLKTLGSYGCQIYLSRGWPGFLALVDQRHLSWGHFPSGARNGHIWGGLDSAELPAAGAALTELVQLRLIDDKMARRGGGLKSCPRCGWPLIVVNQSQSRGLADEQPLKLDCLGGCQEGRRRSRRLDEREPFKSPPKCGVDGKSCYERLLRGRQEFWVCPQHPDGPLCPSHRVLPADPQ